MENVQRTTMQADDPPPPTSIPLKKRKRLDRSFPPTTLSSPIEPKRSMASMNKQDCLETLAKLRNLRLLVDMAELEVLQNLQKQQQLLLQQQQQQQQQVPSLDGYHLLSNFGGSMNAILQGGRC